MVGKIIVYVLAGLGAGFATGFSGISAAVVISPMLVSFLNFEAYDAVCIALTADVLAAAEASYNYAKHGHLHLKDSIQLLAAVLVFTFVGSWVSQYMPSMALGSVSVIMTLLMGLKFLFLPVSNLHILHGEQSKMEKLFETLFIGCTIGFVSGFAGAGGGMMTLFALTTFMGYDVKDAVGTSVFIMTFTALVGGISHITLGGFPDALAFAICAPTTLAGAMLSSRVAIRIDSMQLNRVTGIFLTGLGLVMAIVHFFGN